MSAAGVCDEAPGGLQLLIERRAGLMTSLTDLLAQQADAARAVDAG